jgi:hypothetical protein
MGACPVAVDCLEAGYAVTTSDPVVDGMYFKWGDDGAIFESPTPGGPWKERLRPSEAATDETNPKDRIGQSKVSLSKVPPAALAHCAHALMDGASKYGAYNWRGKKVQAGIYVDAAQRHLLSWFEGQESATDSGIHHLGHAMACLAILLDAQEGGNLIDDRPIFDKPDKFDSVLSRLNEQILGGR